MTRIVKVIAAAVFGALILGANHVQAAVEVSTKPTQNMNCSGGICTPTAQKAVLNAGDLANMLAGGDVTISSGSLAQDIEIDAALSWTSVSQLTLDSYHAISFNKPVVVAGTGALTIMTNDGGSGGDFRFFGRGHVEFWDTLSNLVINGQGYGLVSSMNELRIAAKHIAPYLALAKSLHLAKHHYRSSPILSLNAMLEGLGNTISDLTINDTNENDFVGLIGDVGGTPGKDGVRDIGLLSVDIHANGGCVGTLAAGTDDSTVLNSYATGQISIASNGQQFSNAGGLVCANGGTIARSFASVTVSVTGASAEGMVGGLVGVNAGACFGAHCDGSIDESYSTGAVSGIDGTMAGGLVGQNLGGTILNSYATGAVSAGGNAFVGGLVGSNENNSSEQTDPVIMNSYSTCAVSGGSGAMIGGLIGQDIANPGITNTYWDLDTSGINNPAQGAGNLENDPGITGLTDAQLKSGLPAGFDKNVWKEKARINNGYPYLIDQSPG